MTTRIEATHLIPGRGPVIDDGVIILEGAAIAYAGPAAEAPTTPDAEVVVTESVMPGMWDCHAHVMGFTRMSLEDTFRVPVPLRAARATADIQRALRAGFTSIRDACGMGVAIGRAVAEGSIPGPHIYSANALLSPTGGHADLHDLPLEWFHDLSAREGTLRVCDGVADCMTAVREQLRVGADVIKICASGGVLTERDHPIHQQFTRDELEAIVEVAGMAERAVMAHCHGKPGMMAAIEAGVRTIEHGTYLDEETCDAMVETGTILVPTRMIVTELTAAGQGALTPAMWKKLLETDERHQDAVTLAHERGVTIALGTDVAMSRPELPAAWGNQARELGLLVDAGLSPLEAIEAATANAPASLGPRAPHTGQLAEGYDADVITVAGDPSVDVAVLTDIANITGVWKSGELVA